jgi:hypothetical protein
VTQGGLSIVRYPWIMDNGCGQNSIQVEDSHHALPDILRLTDVVGTVLLAPQDVPEIGHNVKCPHNVRAFILVGARGFEPRTP